MNRTFTLSLGLLLIACQIFITPLSAQNKVSQGSTAEISQMSDQQLRTYMDQATAAGMTDEQMIASASAKGLTPDETAALRARIRRLRQTSTADTTITTNRILNYRADSTDKPVAHAITQNGLPVFGSELFTNNNIRFEPNLNLATPVNYIIGPGDQLHIQVYGLSQANWKPEVSPEGNINIPGSGIVNVSGKTITQATAAIRSRLLASRYTLGNGTSLQVSLGNIRSIKVIMVGQLVKPGTYTLPSLATVFNALYAAGGPGANGSYRAIEVIRNNRVIRKLDVYDFLVNGDQRSNINLQDQDIIRVPTYQVRVSLAGQVKIPGIFEVTKGESLQNVIDFAGGFTDSAYTTRIKVAQIVDGHRHITDILAKDYGTYMPMKGDQFTTEAIVNRYDNRVTILGAVFRPGNYQLDNGLTLSQLIGKAEGLKEDAYPDRGTITRLQPDNTTLLLSFNVKAVMNKQADITLQREDVVRIASLFDLRDTYQVTVTGEVRRPGLFAYSDSMRVEDLVFMAGGFALGASPKRIEVSRRIISADPSATSTAVARVFLVNSDQQLSTEARNFVLKPFDIVSVFSTPGYETQRLVKVEGEVLHPGTYAIQRTDEKISDLLLRAGGPTSLADITGSTLRRENTLGLEKSKADNNEIRQNRQQQLTRLNTGGPTVTDTLPRNNYVGIDLARIMREPGSRTDLLLQDGDLLRIPKKEQTVTVNGEVLYPSAIVYDKGHTVRDYIDNAGSYSAQAWPKRAYVVYPNGTVRSTHKFLFFKIYPSVRPGSEIFVPRKPYHPNNTMQEIFGITGGLASIGAIILGIISLSK